jgi:type II secretory pathway pseudopilin PulG
MTIHTTIHSTTPARGRTDVRGFTLVEVSIILMVLSVLSLVLLPGLGSYLRDARLARARGDVAAIQAAVVRFLEDTGEGVFRCIGNGNRDTSDGGTDDPSNPDPYYTLDMLISDGDTPDRGRNAGDSWRWREPWSGHPVDTLANHLVKNTPGYDWTARYRTPEDIEAYGSERQVAFASQAGLGARFAWRGPYVSAAVSADPWGNRYAVNVLFLDPGADSATGDGSGYLYDIFVLSAGPDEAVDTPFSIDGVVPGDDDIIRVIAGGSR